MGKAGYSDQIDIDVNELAAISGTAAQVGTAAYASV